MATSNTVNQQPANKRAASSSQAAKPGSNELPFDQTQPGDSALRASLYKKVQAYLDRFSSAMTEGDTESMASLWAMPSFLVSKSNTSIIQSAADLEPLFGSAPEMFKKRGIEETYAEIQVMDIIDERLVMVLARWPYLNKAGEEFGEESSTYILKADDSGEFKLCVLTMRGEKNGSSAENNAKTKASSKGNAEPAAARSSKAKTAKHN